MHCCHWICTRVRYSFIQQTTNYAIDVTYLQLICKLVKLLSSSSYYPLIESPNKKRPKYRERKINTTENEHQKRVYLRQTIFGHCRSSFTCIYRRFAIFNLLLLLIFLRMLTIQPHVCRLRLWKIFFFCFSIHFLYAFDLFPVKCIHLLSVWCDIFVSSFASSLLCCFFFFTVSSYRVHCFRIEWTQQLNGKQTVTTAKL